MATLRYVPVRDLEGLTTLDTCTFRRTPNRGLWLLWFYVARVTDGVAELMAVLVNPGGDGIPAKSNEERHVWGLKRSAPGTWQISPSIDVKQSANPDSPSVWHETLEIVDVPEPPPWERTEE